MSVPLRILMLSKACVVGIYQRKLEYIAQHNIDLLTLVPSAWRDERGELLLERVYTTGYQLETLPIRFNGNFHLHHYTGLGKRIREFRPDIIHIDEEPYNLVAWQLLYHARRLGCKTLFFSWQNIHRHYPPPFSWGERWVMNTVDYALVGTESAGDVWREKGYTGKMAVIPQFGTDPDLFTPPSTRPERPFTIGYVGRLVEEKGVQVLLDAVAQLDNRAWQLKIYGGGPYETQLRAQITRLSLNTQVEFCGQVPSTQMPQVYPNFDVFVLPSLTRSNWKEQFGRVLVEAMASGVPVIGSDSGAIPDVIGDGGVVTPEGDAHMLAQALAQLQSDSALHKHFAMLGRERVLAHFTHEQIALATVQFYQTMMDG